MHAHRFITLVSLGAILATATGLVFVVGGAPAPGHPGTPLPTDDGDRAGSTGSIVVDDSRLAEGTVPPRSGRNGGGGSPTPTAATSASGAGSYAFSVTRIEPIAPTGAAVVASVTNRADRPRTGVVVETRISAGGEPVWRGTERVGRLAPGETHTIERTVETDLGGALAVERNGGVVTVETVVRSEQGVERYEIRRQAVAPR
ncbi:hypothetical protein ACFQPA_04540 [Halomarina halobia]|uniref:Uncharacterized protein n=1 Tax=Halomarina halobia TaxID=3033386 RepID=A0ABD6A5M4_9EURY|nr:hypothetical protein [Halomarina sp. PSR21]